MNKIIYGFISIVLAISMVLPFASVVFADNTTKVDPQPVIPMVLMLRAKDIADVGQPVAIQVYSKYTNKPVEGAGVYALKASQITITADKENYTTNGADYAQIARDKGIFLGYTNNGGIIQHSFGETGKYLLVAVKNGYVPGSDWISITLAAKKGLTLIAPDYTEVGKEVIFKVVDRDNGAAISGAALYAMKIGTINTPSVTSSNSNDTVKYAAEIKNSGIYIGNTDREGKVSYKFKESGHFVLVALKDDYAPGFGKIGVNSNSTVALGIKAPDSVEVGKKVTITVIERTTGKPVEKAAVYALKINEIPTPLPVPLPRPIQIPQSINSTNKYTVQSVNATLLPAPKAEPLLAVNNDEYMERAFAKGIQLGVTNELGEITYAFMDTGRYIIVARKEGYLPGFMWMNVKLAQQYQNALRIKSPADAVVGTQVSFTVYDKNTYKPVAGAVVYGLKIKLTIMPTILSTSNTIATQKIIEAIPADKEASKYADEAQKSGFLIGTTNNSGEVSYAFAEEGRYIIVAVKDTYIPGYTKIDINKITEKALNVIAPPVGEIKRPVTIKVTDKANNKPVVKAGVYTLKIAEITESKPISEVLKPEVDEKSMAQSYAVLAKQKGSFIGWTDDNGKVTHQYNDTGHYILIAIKDDYAPGFGKIKIQLTTIDKLIIRVPGEVVVNQPVTISVLDKNSQNGLGEVAVYAYKIEGFFNTIGMAIRQAFATDTSGKSGFATDVSEEGFFIDYTDENGNIVYSFTETGSYLLIAIKGGYLPDFAKTNVNQSSSK